MTKRKPDAKQSPWTPERVELLKSMWLGGYTSGQIARTFDVTRNAVIGKVQRLGLPPRKTTTNQHSGQMKKTKANPLSKNTAAASSRMEEPKSEGLSLLDLTNKTCRWPIGDPGEGDFHFCGTAKEPDAGPYCPYHSRVAYTDKAARQRAREKWEAKNRPYRASRLMFELEVF